MSEVTFYLGQHDKHTTLNRTCIIAHQDDESDIEIEAIIDCKRDDGTLRLHMDISFFFLPF